MAAIFEQAVLSIQNPIRFDIVHRAVELSFSQPNVSGFLGSVERMGLRIRDFETVLRAKLLGQAAIAEYSQLGDSDQGQIREFYLVSLERVGPEVREKFFKLYAYY